MNIERRPGREIPEENLWEPRVDQKTMKEMGVTGPQGQFFPFEHGEKFALIKNERGNRIPTIIDSEGNHLPFREWAEKQDSN